MKQLEIFKREPMVGILEGCRPPKFKEGDAVKSAHVSGRVAIVSWYFGRWNYYINSGTNLVGRDGWIAEEEAL